MELQTYLSILKKWKKLIAIVFSVLFVLIVIVTLLIPPKYSSTARLRVLTPLGGGTNYLNFDIWYATRLMNTYASMASSSAVKDEINKKFNRTTDTDISATVIADSEIIRITVLDSDPIMSAAIANSIAEILLASKNNSAVQAQTASEAAISAQLEAVNKKLVEARAKYRAIFIPFTQNNFKIEQLNTQVQNDRSMYVTIKDRIEAGRQSRVSADILAVQEAQLAQLQTSIDQKTVEIEAMNAKAAEDSNQINSAQRDISLLENQYSNIVLQMDQLKSLQALQYGSESLILVDEALPGAIPAVPNYLLVFTLGFSISLFLAFFTAVTLENMDNANPSLYKISSHISIPPLGEPLNQGLSSIKQLSKPKAKEPWYKNVNELTIEIFSKNQSLHSVILSGVEKDSNFTGTLVNMALEFARQGRKTILIDGNLNNPTIHKSFPSVGNEFGLRDVLDRKVSLKAALKETGRNNLTVLTAGRPEPIPEKNTDLTKMGRIIEDLQTSFSINIIGIPSLIMLRGTENFVYKTDGVVLIFEQGKSQEKNMQESIDFLNSVKIPLLGYINCEVEKSETDPLYSDKPTYLRI